jgi:hypothetical protein
LKNNYGLIEVRYETRGSPMMSLRPGIALVCVYLTLNLGCGNSTQDSRNMAEKATVQANQLKQQLQQHVENPSGMRNLADNIEKYVALAEKDGSLNHAEATIRSRKDITSDVQRTLQQYHLKDLLLQASKNFRVMADGMNVPVTSTRSAYLVMIDWKLVPVKRLPTQECDVYESSFNWILAIGGVASLGGVDPLGDLLLAIGGVGAAVTHELCV